MTESLEDLLRAARAAGVTAVSIDGAHRGAVRVGAWRRVTGYTVTYHDDIATALMDALTKAMAPPVKRSTDLSSLLD